MSTEQSDFDQMRETINDWEQFEVKLNDLHNIIVNQSGSKPTEEQKAQVLQYVYEQYAQGLELISFIKDMLTDYRKEFKIKDADVKKWMKEDEDAE